MVEITRALASREPGLEGCMRESRVMLELRKEERDYHGSQIQGLGGTEKGAPIRLGD